MAIDIDIPPLSSNLLDEARARLDGLTKPRGSLGALEGLAARCHAIRGGASPLVVAPATMFTVAADHGVARQDVSPYPQAVTGQMVRNFLEGGAAINALCAVAGMDMKVVDAGCACPPFAPHPMLVAMRLGYGTEDMTQGPAMSRAVAERAVEQGIGLARDAVGEGCACLGVGEMGIANSTAAAAVHCALLGLEPASVVGAGAGADAAMMARKAAVVERALAVNRMDGRRDPLDVLAAVGGFEIGVMCGIMLGGAAHGVPVLVDGFISTSACALGLAIRPGLSGYVLLSHVSAERGHAMVLQSLRDRFPELAPPLLDLGMRLGEGTGAAVAYVLVKCAAAVYNDMATFNGAGVSDSGRQTF
ncbi:MAG: nicotinate-nucleotide--dimethylbenzimidazole phosphoribosyltransferase [Desulfovibrio sp.]|jgi:nicotinate-nucleotide--dimethylbenzimidazole phosphoribosyltransferase|nr:nicotinate-nucleotide--dimethylbenzimidazole phosphoribosyltransferase [Desulfovibrio sp.]